jgi:hypothetical protein
MKKVEVILFTLMFTLFLAFPVHAKIKSRNIAKDTILAENMAPDSVGSSEIAANAVGDSELIDSPTVDSFFLNPFAFDVGVDTPTAKWQVVIDSGTDNVYLSTGVANCNDWQKIGSQ